MFGEIKTKLNVLCKYVISHFRTALLFQDELKRDLKDKNVQYAAISTQLDALSGQFDTVISQLCEMIKEIALIQTFQKASLKTKKKVKPKNKKSGRKR